MEIGDPDLIYISLIYLGGTEENNVRPQPLFLVPCPCLEIGYLLNKS